MASFCIRALLAFSMRSDSGEMRGIESGGRKAEERERERQREGGRWVHLFRPLSPIPHPSITVSLVTFLRVISTI